MMMKYVILCISGVLAYIPIVVGVPVITTTIYTVTRAMSSTETIQ